MPRPVFQLHLHTRQGNDLDNWLEHTKTPSHAFAEWAKSFREHEKVCVQLANALEGTRIDVEALGDDVFLIPTNDREEQILRALEKDEVVFEALNLQPWWGDDDEEITEVDKPKF